MSQNLNWTREELILALDLYFQIPFAKVTQHHPDIIELSHFLQQLPIYPATQKSASFRSPSSVNLKLSNFKSLDPKYQGVGLDASSKLDKEIWNDFATHPALLKETAQAIRAAYQAAYQNASGDTHTDEEEEFMEGRVLTRLHKQRERNAKIVEKKKKAILQKYGVLECEVCGFDFEKVYGEIGKGFAECHHLIPLSQLTDTTSTTLNDLAILCANCHRMIHKARPLLSVQAIRELVNMQQRA